ncbi:MAG TPA: UDP-N-acetylmuramoyl-L-alanyl-D-glutamate--2,6-diaminopimelate ligase [Thermomicrobiales bacterium]|nr:UDP-N-acetylmuramoyl-L-alanyl-D-glutamate--2,6-diaminopimelate ligase [Thermomicrobiales bacterium]
MRTTIAALLRDAPGLAAGARVLGDVSTSIEEIAYDSRAVGPGTLFVALRGALADGHRYVSQAIERGAVAVLAEEPVGDERVGCTIVVPDSRAALAQAALAFFRQPTRELGLIGVTGTKGKTTVSFLIEALLAGGGQRTGLIGTVDLKVGARRWRNPVHLTTPESLDVQRYLRQMADASTDWAVLETSSHALATHRVDGCAYDIAVITNVTHEHLDFHGTYERYWAAKAALFDRLAATAPKEPPRPRAALINLDDAGARAMLGRAAGVRELTYGFAPEADVRAEDVTSSEAGLAFRVRSPWGNLPVRVPLLGDFNVSNVLAATGVALVAGVAPAAIAAALAGFSGVPGRLQRIDEGQPFLTVVDFAHNPDSLVQVLRLLRTLVPGRLIAVFGSAGERDVAKRALMGAVCADLADFGIFTDEDPRGEDPRAIVEQIAAGAAARGWRENQHYELQPDRRAALARAVALARPGDAVLLAGKGHEQTIEYADRSLPWDEATEARAALRRQGYDGVGQAGRRAGGQ